MANLMLACAAITQKATLTSSMVAAGLPLSNLKTSPIGQLTRFLTPDEAYIQIDLGENPQAIDLIALLGHNASAAGEVRVVGAADVPSLTSAPDYDSGALPMTEGDALARNHFLLHLPAGIALRYWRISMGDASLTYIDVGRLYLSKVFQPETNMDYGTQEGFIDPSTIARTKSGRGVPNERPKYRYAEFSLTFGSKEEMFGQAFDLDRWSGTTRDVLFINNYDDKPLLQKRTIYGRMAALNPVVNAYYQLFEKTYRIEEIIE